VRSRDRGRIVLARGNSESVGHGGRGFPPVMPTYAGQLTDEELQAPRLELTCSSPRGPQNPVEIKALVEAVAPKPFNLLVVRDIGLRVEEIAALGVRRISGGGALALAAWTGFMQAAQTLKSDGSFAGFARLVPYAEIDGLFTGAVQGARLTGCEGCPEVAYPQCPPTRLRTGRSHPVVRHYRNVTGAIADGRARLPRRQRDTIRGLRDDRGNGLRLGHIDGVAAGDFGNR
jgi:hypothetical protein